MPRTEHPSPVLSPVLIAALGLFALAVLALLWALWPRGGVTGRRSNTLKAVNPALDIKFSYDGGWFALGENDPSAEYPLALDSVGPSGEPDGQVALLGKRIQGLGALLGKAPGAMLYDFVGTQHAESFEQNYKLEPMGEPVYEDLEIAGGLGLRQVLAYSRPDGASWPSWFPPAVHGGKEAHVEGWVFFKGDDLFFVYSISPTPIEDDTRAVIGNLLSSIEFGAGMDAGDAVDGSSNVQDERSAPSVEGEGSSQEAEGAINP